mgnify:CR=1 FL=1
MVKIKIAWVMHDPSYFYFNLHSLYYSPHIYDNNALNPFLQFQTIQKIPQKLIFTHTILFLIWLSEKCTQFVFAEFYSCSV